MSTPDGKVKPREGTGWGCAVLLGAVGILLGIAIAVLLAPDRGARTAKRLVTGDVTIRITEILVQSPCTYTCRDPEVLDWISGALRTAQCISWDPSHRQIGRTHEVRVAFSDGRTYDTVMYVLVGRDEAIALSVAGNYGDPDIYQTPEGMRFSPQVQEFVKAIDKFR